MLLFRLLLKARYRTFLSFFTLLFSNAEYYPFYELEMLRRKGLFIVSNTHTHTLESKEKEKQHSRMHENGQKSKISHQKIVNKAKIIAHQLN